MGDLGSTAFSEGFREASVNPSNVIPLDRHAVRSRKGASRRSAERAVYTVREVADLLGIALGSAYALVRQGEVPARQLGEGGRWVISKERFHAWLDEDGQDIDNDLIRVGAA
jgi:excisionase family DNA binding protein